MVGRIADDHFFDTFTSRTCHGHPLPCNSTGGCVLEADAAKVFALGDFEYKWVLCILQALRTLFHLSLFPECSYIWNTAVNATAYTQLTFGMPLSRRSITHGNVAKVINIDPP